MRRPPLPAPARPDGVPTDGRSGCLAGAPWVVSAPAHGGGGGGLKAARAEEPDMDRSKILALLFTVLMVVSSVAYAVSFL